MIEHTNEPPSWMRLVHALSRVPGAYKLQQYVAYPTTSRFRQLLTTHVALASSQRVLDVACGIGNYRNAFAGDYYGADINAAYIEAARKVHSGHFDVMDCAHLTFPDAFFDHVVLIAATHHFGDVQLRSVIRSALRVCRPGGAVHVIDAVLPKTGNRLLKTAWFRLDAGRFPRTQEQLRDILREHVAVGVENLLPGPLHDCAYFRLDR